MLSSIGCLFPSNCHPILQTDGQWTPICLFLVDRIRCHMSFDIRRSIESNGWSDRVRLKNWQADPIGPSAWKGPKPRFTLMRVRLRASSVLNRKCSLTWLQGWFARHLCGVIQVKSPSKSPKVVQELILRIDAAPFRMVPFPAIAANLAYDLTCQIACQTVPVWT